MQLVVVVSSFNLTLTFNGHIFSLLIVYFSIITLNKGNVGTNHLNNRILLFVCNRKVIYYYYITLPSITITITFGNFQSITITITGKSGYYILQLHITYYYYPIPARYYNVRSNTIRIRWVYSPPDGRTGQGIYIRVLAVAGNVSIWTSFY